MSDKNLGRFSHERDYENQQQSQDLDALSFKPRKGCTNEACQTNPPLLSYSGDPISYYELTDVDYDSLDAIVNFAYTGV